MFKDVLLPVPSYPDGVPEYVLDQAAALCAGLGENLCALGVHLRFPVKDNRLANLLIGLGGAFGHSRVREFILGGATQSVLSDPPVPVFCAH